MSDRQTGRTREQLRACREAAVQGKSVLYATHSAVMSDYARRLLLTLGPAQRVTRELVEYEGGGSVRFVFGPADNIGRFQRGRAFDRLVHDHAYWECVRP